MNCLSKVLIIKIAGTIILWCIPLLIFPHYILNAIGIDNEFGVMVLRLLSWSYFALCVGYGFGLIEALNGRRPLGVIWVGIVSNSGGCLLLLYYFLSVEWSTWPWFIHVVGWGSVLGTAAITIGLIKYGVFGDSPRT